MKRKSAPLVTDRPNKKSKTSPPLEQQVALPVLPNDIYCVIFSHCDKATLLMLYHVLAKNKLLAKCLRKRLSAPDELLPRELQEFAGTQPNIAGCYQLSALLGYSDVMLYLFPILKTRCTYLGRTALGAAEDASKAGQLLCLQLATQHLRETPVPTRSNGSIAFYSAKHGNFECLKYAHENGYYWSASVPTIAARYGYNSPDHFKCFQYALDHGCPWDKLTLEEVAYSAGFPVRGPFVDYAHEHGMLAKMGIDYQ